MTHHGMMQRLEEVPPRSRYFDKGRFGRMFPSLPPFAADTRTVREALKRIGAVGGIMDAADNAVPPGQPNPKNPENPAGLPAGFTFLGQFLDHDLTFDPTSSLERQNDPESIENFRTPFLELDSVYGAGPAADPQLYDRRTRNLKFLIDDAFPDDLPRNSQNTAVTADPRNDENLIVSQLHLAFLKFHNVVVDRLQGEGRTHENELFSEAQRIVRWHYQWLILKEFLPRTCGTDVVKDVLANGRKFYKWNNEPFIPVEFSVGAYRFGHSQVRPGYVVNTNFRAALFARPPEPPPAPDEPGGANDPNDLRGGVRSPRQPFRRFVEWERFFPVEGGDVGRLQISKRIDTVLSTPLFELPQVPNPDPNFDPASLAHRNLLRSLTFELPSGQEVARSMQSKAKKLNFPCLSREDLADLAEHRLDGRTPLWFYLLREAELHGKGSGKAGGATLGPVGARIVAEVFIGVIEGDRLSYLRREPDWEPHELGIGKEFSSAHLLKLSGARLAGPPDPPAQPPPPPVWS